MNKPKRKKCWFCSRTRATKFFPAHNKIARTVSTNIRRTPVQKEKKLAYIHTTIRIEPQGVTAKSVCCNCMDGVHDMMMGAVT